MDSLSFWKLMLVLYSLISMCSCANDGLMKVTGLRVISGNCRITRHAKTIEISPCEKGVHLVDSFSTIDIPCKELPNILLHGPVHLTTGDCEIYGEITGLCPSLIDQNVRSINCRESISEVTIFLLCLTVISVMGLAFMVRWTCLTKKVTESDGAAYLEPNLYMNYSKLISGVPVRNQRRITKTQVVIWFLLFWRPATSLEYSASVGDTITVGDLTVRVNEAYFYSMLTHLYDTSDYTCKITYWKECNWDNCVKHNPCTGRSHFKKNSIVHGFLMGFEHSWCTPGHSECVFTLGCEMWTTSCLFTNPSYKVFSMTPIRYHLNVTGTSHGSCLLKDSKIEIMDFQLDGTIVTNDKDTSYYCPSFSPFLKYGSSLSVEVKQPISCISTERYGPMCDFPENYTRNHLEKDCVRLPGRMNGLRLSVLIRTDKLLIEADSDVELDIDCDENKINYSSCGGIYSELHGLRDSPIGVMLRMAPKVHMVGFWKGHMPCYDEEMIIDCMGNGIVLPMSYNSVCLNNASYNDKTVGIYQFTNDRFTSIESYKTVEDSSSYWSALTAFHSTYLGISSSSFTVASWMALAYLLLKR